MGEHYVDIVGVAGSIPAAPTIKPLRFPRLPTKSRLPQVVSPCTNKPGITRLCPEKVGKTWAKCFPFVLAAAKFTRGDAVSPSRISTLGEEEGKSLDPPGGVEVRISGIDAPEMMPSREATCKRTGQRKKKKSA